MAKPNGIITRKDVIQEDALNWGPEYQKQVQIAIDSNKTWAKSIKDIYDAQQLVRGASNNTEFLKAKQQEALATQRIIQGIKEQEAAELSANRIKVSSIAASEAERKAKLALETAESRLQRTKEANVKKTTEEIYNQGILARNSKNQAILNSKLSTEYEKLTVKQRMAATVLQNIVIIGKKADETQQQYNLRLRIAQTEFDRLNVSVVAANRAIGRFNDNVGNYPSQAGAQIKDLMSAFGVVVGVDLFATSLQEAFDVVRNFEAEMVNLAAVAGYSREEIAPLEADIREVAKVSINSATDVAKLATELVKLGSTPEEVSKLLKPVNDLSIALQASAEDSATLVKSLLNSYQQGAEQATHFTDVLAESANRSALDFAGLRDAFSYVAPVANTLGISVEKTAALIGTLADNGIKAESAGRLLSTGLGKLAGQGLTLEDALGKINKAQKEGKSRLEVLTVANNLFGAEAGKLALILANNTKKIDESTIAYENSAGALSELTEKQLKSVNSELEMLSSAWEEYILNTNDAAGGTRIMTNVLSFLSSNLDVLADVILSAAVIWGVYKASIAVAKAQQYLMTLATKISTLASAENTVANEINAVAVGESATASTVLATSQTATSVSTNLATASMAKFNAILKANALFLIIGALLTVIYLYNKFNKSLDENYQEVKKSTDAFLKNSEIIKGNVRSINALSDRYDVLKNKTKLNSDEQKELNKIIQILGKTVPDAVVQVNKYGDAMSINTTKTRAFVKQQEELYKLKNQQKLIENKEILKDLIKQQENYNKVNKDGYWFQVEGIGNVMTRRGKLVTEGLLANRDLTLSEQILFKERVLGNEKNIAQTKENIRLLSGLSNLEKKLAKDKADANKSDEKGPRTIEIIDEEIKAQEELIKTLSDKTGKEGNILKAKIKALNDERDLIYNNNKGQEKDAAALAKKQLDNAKRIRDAIYNLNQFRLQNQIDVNQALIDDEKTSTNQRIALFYELNQYRNAKNDETLEHELINNIYEKQELEKLSVIKRNIYIKDQTARVQSIINGSLAVEKMTNAEKLIYEKFNAEKKKLYILDAANKQKIIDEEAVKVKKRIDDEIQERETQINHAVEAENTKFNEINKAENQSRKERERAIEEHERKIYEIRKTFALNALKLQIDGLQKELYDNSLKGKDAQISADLRKKIEFDLQKAKTDYSDLNYDQYLDLNKDKIEQEIYTAEKILDVSSQLSGSLASLTNAVFDGKIQQIDAEIAKNNEKYDKEIELADKDEKQKALLQKEREKKNDELEKKKRKEQHKQAVFNKAVTVAQIGLQTALAIITAAAATAPTFWGVAIAAAIGAIELGAALATPIPKYKDGRIGGPKEVAMINDGGVPEVVESKDGSARIYSGKNRIVQLYDGDTVHKSVDKYNKLQRAAMMASLNMEGRKMNDFQASQYFEASYGKELLQELKQNTLAIKNQKQAVYNAPKIDIPHSIWKSKNTNW